MGGFTFDGHGANVVGSLGSGSLVQDMPTAMEFNGTTTHASSSATWTGLNGATDFAVTWWQKRAGNQNARVINAQGTAGETLYMRFDGSGDASDLEYQVNLTTTDIYIGAGTAGDFASDGTEWQHYACTYDGTNAYMYRNGVQIGTAAAEGTVVNATSKLFVGCYHSGTPSTFYTGSLRDMRIFTSGLTATQVTSVFEDTAMGGIGVTPVNWYYMEEGTGATLNDSGSANIDLGIVSGSWDASMYNLNQIGAGSISDTATIRGGTWNLRDSTHLDFNGVNVSVGMGDVTILDGKAEATVSCWMYRKGYETGTTERTGFVCKDNAIECWVREANTSQCAMSINNDHRAFTGIEVPQDEWTHVVMTYQGSSVTGDSNDRRRLYLNGVLESTNSDGTRDTITNSASELSIGGRVTNYSYSGSLSDVSIYDTALTQSQIDLLYNAQWDGSPVGWWKLNEGSGVTCADSSPNGNNGTFDNTPTWVNPTYTYGTGKLDINSGTILSAPRGDFVFGPATFQNASDGTYTHNNGNFVLPVGSHYIQGNGNTTFYDVSGTGTGYSHFLIYTSGQTKTIEHDIMEGAGNDTIIKMVGPATKLILGTDSYASQMNCAYFDGTSGVIQYVYGANKLFPAVIGSGVYPRFLGKNGGSTYMATDAHVKWLDVQADIELPDASKFLILDGDMKFADVTVEVNQTLDLNGQRAEFGGNFSLIGTLSDTANGAFAYFKGTYTRTGGHSDLTNTNTTFVAEGGGTSDYYNPVPRRLVVNTDSTITFNNPLNEASAGSSDFIVAAGTVNANNQNINGKNQIVIASGGTYTAGSSTINCKEDFNMAGGLIGKSAIVFNGVAGEIHTSSGYIDNLFDDGATAEFWINAAGGGEDGEGRIIDKYASAMALQVVDGAGANKLQFQQKFGDNDGIWITDDLVITDDKWHHVALTYNNSADTNDPIIYVDGKQVAITETSIPDGDRDSDGGGLMIFGNTSLGTKTFDGVMAMVRFWDVIRTEAQLRTEMFSQYSDMGGVGVPEAAGLILMYQFDSGNGLPILDSSTKGLNGTLGGAATWAGPGTFTYDTSTLKFDNDGGTCTLYAPRDGTRATTYGLTITDGTDFNIDVSSDPRTYGPLVHSGSDFTINRNYGYYSNDMPIVGASSDLTLGGGVFYYYGTAASGAATDYQNLYNTGGGTLTMQGDFTSVSTMKTTTDSITHFNGYHGTIRNIKALNSGNIVMEAGSGINFTNEGFLLAENNNLQYITTNGEAATMFTDNRDAMYIGAGVSATYDALGSFSFSCWTKILDNGDIRGLITKGWTGNLGFYTQLNADGKIAYWTWHDPGVVANALTSATAVDDGAWHHIGFTYNDSDGKKVIYIDGAPDASSSTSPGGNLNECVELFGLGNWFSSASKGSSTTYGLGYERGSLADVRVWDGTVLSDANMVTLGATNAATSVSGAYADNPSDPSSWWKLGNTGSGAPAIDLNDYGTNGYDAVMTGSSASPAGMKSGFVTVTGTATYGSMNNVFENMTLTNTYISGMADIVVGQFSDGGVLTANTDATFTTKGTVVLD